MFPVGDDCDIKKADDTCNKSSTFASILCEEKQNLVLL